MNLFEEIGMLPEIFDRENYENLLHQGLALHALLPRLRTATLVRTVEGSRWEKEASRRCSGSPAAQKVLQFLINNGRIIPEESCGGTSFKDWLSSYAESHQRREMRLILSDDLSGSNPDFKPKVTNISQVVTEDWWSDLSLNVEVGDTEESFLAAIRLLLMMAARVDIIDPWLLPTRSSCRHLLKRMLEEIMGNLRHPQIRLHSSLQALKHSSEDKYDRKIWTNHFMDLHCLLLKKRRAGQVLIWRPEDIPDKFHDRYLLTELGSCSVGQGFEIKRGYKNRLYLLDRSLQKSLQDFYKADRATIPGTLCFNS